MEYGLIGEHLGHSFSKEIHESFAEYEYEIKEIEPAFLDSFMKEKRFNAINVTIPYKEKVIPYLSETDPFALEIGAVNTIINDGGSLRGYNTDFYGMRELIRHAGIDIKGKKVAILGSGGTAKTAYAVASNAGAREILKVSRSGKDGAITYEQLYSLHNDAEMIINTTPVGMFPSTEEAAIDLSLLPSVNGVIDAIYNPLRTKLVSEAKARGIACEGGLYMLVSQAVKASEYFVGKEYPSDTTEKVFNGLIANKENIVLTGMPACGKSTVAGLLSEKLGRKAVDTDTLIVEKAGMAITEIFERFGETVFRDLESEVISEVSRESGIIIATGGGAILREENVSRLKRNGRLYFIDRPLSALIPTQSRPLSSSREAIEKRYAERYAIYTSTADFRISADRDAKSVADMIANTHLTRRQ